MNSSAHYLALFLFLFVPFFPKVMAQNEQLAEAEIDTELYGKGRSIGVTIFGTGVGAIGRKVMDSGDQIEFNISYTGQLVGTDEDDEDNQFYSGIDLVPGYNFLVGEKLKDERNERKLIKNFISLKAGYTFSHFNRSMGMLTWRRESFKEKNTQYGFGLELGFIYYGPVNPQDLNLFPSDGAGIFFRLDWNFYR